MEQQRGLLEIVDAPGGRPGPGEETFLFWLARNSKEARGSRNLPRASYVFSPSKTGYNLFFTVEGAVFDAMQGSFLLAPFVVAKEK